MSNSIQKFNRLSLSNLNTKNLHRQSRLFFHLNLKPDKKNILQEKCFLTILEDAQKNLCFKELIKMLKERKIILLND